MIAPAKPGILIVRGSSLKISNIGFTIDRVTGDVTTKPVVPTAQVDFWPYWLRIAIEHLPQVRSARLALASAAVSATSDDSKRETRALENEIAVAMVVIAAAAFSVEAFSAMVHQQAGLETGVGRSTSAARRIAEILRQAFVIDSRSFHEVRSTLGTVFRVRNLAVHPPAAFQEFHPHPVTASVPIPFAAFTLENSEAALRFILDMLVWCTSSPRPGRPRPFREWCDRQQESVAPLLDLWADLDTK